jgi:hypothetical protein
VVQVAQAYTSALKDEEVDPDRSPPTEHDPPVENGDSAPPVPSPSLVETPAEGAPPLHEADRKAEKIPLPHVAPPSTFAVETNATVPHQDGVAGIVTPYVSLPTHLDAGAHDAPNGIEAMDTNLPGVHPTLTLDGLPSATNSSSLAYANLLGYSDYTTPSEPAMSIATGHQPWTLLNTSSGEGGLMTPSIGYPPELYSYSNPEVEQLTTGGQPYAPSERFAFKDAGTAYPTSEGGQFEPRYVSPEDMSYQQYGSTSTYGYGGANSHDAWYPSNQTGMRSADGASGIASHGEVCLCRVIALLR